MRIQYASDLHLVFPLNYQYVTSKGLLPEGDVLVLAGDVADLFYLHRYDAGAKNISNTQFLSLATMTITGFGARKRS